MAIETRPIEIDCAGAVMRGYAAWDGSLPAPAGGRPGILIAPNFMGMMEIDESKARQIAALGYVGLAFDYFAKPGPAADMTAAMAQMQALVADRQVVVARMKAALAALRGLDMVDPQHVAAIGYCLGGKCVLDLARSGEAFDAAVVFHGVFDPPPFANAERIIPKLLVCHGWDDPLCPPDAVVGLAAELTAAKADWQLNAYGHVVHGFTNPGNPPAYNADADRLSWAAACALFAERWG